LLLLRQQCRWPLRPEEVEEEQGERDWWRWPRRPREGEERGWAGAGDLCVWVVVGWCGVRVSEGGAAR